MTRPSSSLSTVAWSAASSIGTVGGDDGALGAGTPVGGDRVHHVEAVDVVGAQHDQQLGRVGDHLVAEPVELVGVALREALLVGAARALLRHQQPQPAPVAVEVPRPPVGDLLPEAGALELHRQPDVGDAAVGQVGQREVDQLEDAGERQRRLGPLPGQDVHPAAGAAGLDQGEDAGTGHASSWHARCMQSGRDGHWRPDIGGWRSSERETSWLSTTRTCRGPWTRHRWRRTPARPTWRRTCASSWPSSEDRDPGTRSGSNHVLAGIEKDPNFMVESEPKDYTPPSE